MIDLWPEMTTIIMNDDLVKELNQLLEAKLSYDTTFNLGDFYVSVFMIHDRKKAKISIKNDLNVSLRTLFS